MCVCLDDLSCVKNILYHRMWWPDRLGMSNMANVISTMKEKRQKLRRKNMRRKRRGGSLCWAERSRTAAVEGEGSEGHGGSMHACGRRELQNNLAA